VILPPDLVIVMVFMRMRIVALIQRAISRGRPRAVRLCACLEAILSPPLTQEGSTWVLS